MKLIQGDCLQVMDTLISDGVQVDLIVTSPPYDNLRTYNDTLNWNEDIWKAVIERLYKITTVGGVVVWIVGDATIKGSETGTSFKQALYAMECGFNLHDTMIYQKKSSYAHDPKNKRYKSMFEYMFIWSKGKPKTYNEIKDVPNKHAGKKISGTKGRNAKGEQRVLKEFIISGYQARSNIWNIPSSENVGNHPAPFPYKLAQDHIISWSNEGDTVLDPFMGSGTTGVACKNTGRDFIGIELDEGYYNIAKERIENTTVQNKLNIN